MTPLRGCQTRPASPHAGPCRLRVTGEICKPTVETSRGKTAAGKSCLVVNQCSMWTRFQPARGF
ncbi:Hypothetical protein SMAX5B_011339 [Scophthalmus maximus]|uniref:Uncharacterized protein n=1 Tax=Scophthalmus maximus TaxID=52904 RepID=A0A2U9BMF9_SCOMX|nr:Hypothetical protein SMAX5B_011339 [Scophthalmus maximus]